MIGRKWQVEGRNSSWVVIGSRYFTCFSEVEKGLSST